MASMDSCITQERHRIELESALENLRMVDFDTVALEVVLEYIRAAACHLGRITGKISSEEVLVGIFERFCIGK
jgi:tRNA U34 5-carboxymethylaminomethyl modifying GTPase MnmE/TrmE